MKDLDELAKTLPDDAATLLRSVRQRLSAIPGLVQRWDARGPGRGELVLSHTGVELARVFVRSDGNPVLVAGGAEQEIRGLVQAAAAGDTIRTLAAERAAKMPQLDLFK